jgi:flagellin
MGLEPFREEFDMGLTVNTNTPAIQAYQNLENSQAAENQDINQLSSGYKINNASDNAAGYVISQELQSQVNGLGQANQNAQTGISLVQTAEGALNETESILQSIRALTLQAANSTTDSTGLTAIQAQVDQSVQQIDQIATSTQYGNLMVFGSGTTAAAFTFQVGAYGASADQITFSIAGANSAALGLTGIDSFFGASGFSTGMISVIDAAISSVSAMQGALGAYQNRLQDTINNLNVGTQNLSAAESTIKDTDMAATYSDFTKQQILVQTGTAMLSQANSIPQSVLRLMNI